jgi:hypothetical protein
MTNFLLSVISSHKSRVGARESWAWGCPRITSVVCGVCIYREVLEEKNQELVVLSLGLLVYLFDSRIQGGTMSWMTTITLRKFYTLVLLIVNYFGDFFFFEELVKNIVLISNFTRSFASRL